MRRLSFPYVMPYWDNEYVVGFNVRRAALDSLGETAHVEEDPHRTAGGREFIWAFERADGLRIDIVWDEHLNHAVVHADPPDAQQAVAALRILGIDAEFEPRQLPKGWSLQKGHARGAVWLFTGKGAPRPTAVFSRKQLADAWLAKTGYSGELVAYPLDLSRYEAERNFGSANLSPSDSEAAQAFVGTLEERYEYLRGMQLEKPDEGRA